MSNMLNRLRWQLTLFYFLAAFALVALLAGGSYTLLRFYLESSTDLALHYNSVAVHMTVKAGKVGTINGQITTLTNSWTESIPEPATYALLGSGLIALVAVARKAKRN